MHAPAHLGKKPSLHDQVMKRFSEAHEWENQGLPMMSKIPKKIKITFTISLKIGNKMGGIPISAFRYVLLRVLYLLGLPMNWLCAHCSMLNTETQGRLQKFSFAGYWGWVPIKIDTIRANGHAKLTVYERFMRRSWEVHEWLMRRRRVANTTQHLI